MELLPSVLAVCYELYLMCYWDLVRALKGKMATLLSRSDFVLVWLKDPLMWLTDPLMWLTAQSLKSFVPASTVILPALFYVV